MQGGIPYLASNWESTARIVPPNYEAVVEREPDPNTTSRRTPSSSSTDSTGANTLSTHSLAIFPDILRFPSTRIVQARLCDPRVAEKPGRVIFGAVALLPGPE